MISQNNKYILEVKGLTKSFGAVQALDNVDFELKEGELLGLIGDNGAGKSTLIKIISGALTPDKGIIKFENKEVKINQPGDAFNLGIETIYQDLALFENLNFTQNIFVGRERVSRGMGILFSWADDRRMRNEAYDKISDISITLPALDQKIETLSGGQRQAVAFTRAIFWGTKVIIMDEPTAALGVRESARVLEIIEEVKKHVKGIILIAHNIEHVIRIADRVIVLRGGERVGTVDFVDYKDKNGELRHGDLHNDIVKLITGF